tara:strand:- start:174 stop:875 length:702 start_codon:yes stop_codon:yes gene_type:complete
MISVCLASYEDDHFLNDQITSILVQLSKFDELIISDDSQSKKVLNLCNNIQDKRIKYIKGPQKGVVKNFENALKHAKGDIIFLSDQDDIWLKDKVSECIKSLSEYDLVLTNAIVVDENLKIIDELLFKDNLKNLNLLSIFFKNKFIGCCMAFNKNILKQSIPFPRNIPMHDWWIGLVALSKGKVFYNHQPFIKYRRHKSVLTHTEGYSQYNIFTKILFRFNLLRSLLILFLRI